MIVALTGREMDALKALAAGGGVKGAAHKLGLSPKTIEAHVTNMCRKLSANTIIELILITLRAGILDLSDFPRSAVEIAPPPGNFRV